MQFRFADHVLDVERRELRRRGEPIALEPQVFDLLATSSAIATASSPRTICWTRCGAGGSFQNRP